MILQDLGASFAGGLLIGLAAVLLFWANGRIAGISGILSGSFSRDPAALAWRLAFLVGLAGGAWAYHVITGYTPVPRADFPPLMLIAGGLLVGFGTHAGSGCTSGHGVCGISRLSPRSLVATITFMVAGMATVAVIRHLVGLEG